MIAKEQGEAFEIIEGQADIGLLILCDHATPIIPSEFSNLGMSAEQLARHIAFDIGAADVARQLATEFGCPAVLSCFSRLLIDPNRGEDDPTLVMRIADGALIPGNARIGEDEINARITRFYRPYDDAIARTIRAMRATGKNPVIVSMHSYTPEMKGRKRPWHITVIWDFDPRLNRTLLDALAREPDLIVGDNEPYQGGYRGDTMDRHVIRAGLAHALVEIRQDLIATEETARAWGKRLAGVLRPLLSNPDLYEARVHGVHP
ncbi:MAG: N-formylglutamate amidohydrolase [Rhabdaerophilum sp.]